MTTIAEFTAALHGLTITGVTRKFNHVPHSIHASQLPAQILEMPAASRDSDYPSGHVIAVNKLRTCTLVICIEAEGQSTASVKRAATEAMMDAIETALDAYANQTALRISYELRGGSYLVGDVLYYAAIADVSATTFS